MKVIVNVSLKEGVLDPEGQAIKSSLNIHMPEYQPL